jgi:PAS domain S-box-containing protein
MSVGVATGPPGRERVVAPDELFFSTTDHRGVIRSVNSVFLRISRYSADELIGAPHNIVRHPSMPAGAFRLMWDRLAAGRPIGAFVQNRTKDGGHYWVFATATPLGEGFLSVRMTPRSPMIDPVRQLYLQVREAEQDALASGDVDRRRAGAMGAHLIEEGLRSLGFETYDDFVLAALPAEVSSRVRPVTAAYARPWVRGPLGDLLTAAGALDGLLSEQIERLEGYRLLSERLAVSAARVLEVARRLDRAVGSARRASSQVVDSAPVLLNVANVMAQPMHITVTALDRLAPRLHRLKADLATLRFRIALAGLHNAMVAAFAAEVADGMAPAAALREVPHLCDAVHDGVVEMARTARVVNDTLADVAQLVGEAGERLDEFRRFLGQWRILVLRHRAGGALGELLRPIDDEIAAGHQGIELLRALGIECRARTVTMDAGALEVQVGRIRTAAAAD